MAIDVEQVVRENIERTVHMSLATVSGNKPWVCEVHFAFSDNLNLFFRSDPTRRHCQEIIANPNVAGNIIDKYDLGASVVGVYFEGTAKQLDPGEEQNLAATCLQERLKIDEDLIAAAATGSLQLYQISIASWYAFGKFGDAPMQKYELPWGK